MGKNLSSLYYVLIHYLRLGKKPWLLGKYFYFLEKIPAFWEKHPDFGKKIPYFWKNSLIFGKKSLSFGKKTLTIKKKIPDLWKKKNSLIWGTNKIPLYFFAQYIVFYLGRIHDFRGKNPIIRVKLPNSLNPKIKKNNNKKSVWLTFSQLSYFL